MRKVCVSVSVSLLVLLTICFVPSRVIAVDYYVDQNHASSSDQNPGTADLPWKTLSKANSTLQPGDTVYIKAGTYTTYISPRNSGTAAKRISYKNFAADIVSIQNASYGILLNGKSYISVEGINFSNLDRFMYLMNGANYNIIAYCNFDQVRSLVAWAGSAIRGSSSHNWVHHCRFSRYGLCTGTPPNGDDVGVVLEIGNEESMTPPSNTPDYSNYNLIENNTMFGGGHHVLGVMGKYNVIRNNYLHNEAWTNGAGNRSLYMNGYAIDSGWNLIEGNRFGYTAASCDSTITSGTQVTSSNNIFRFNSFFFNNRAGLQFSVSSNYYQDILNNHVYNNTFYRNGLGTSYERDPGHVGIYLARWSGTFVVKNNSFKNNIYYGNPAPYGVYGGPSLTDQTFGGEFNGDVLGDPKFVNATSALGNPLDSAYPDLTLQSSSPCIDVGTHLTTITSPSGSGNVFVVADAQYFTDGWGIELFSGDEIQIVGTSQKAIIVKIDYTTNTITVDRSVDWKQNQGIGIVYAGSAPDVGAHEYGLKTRPPSPRNLRIIETTAQ